MKGKKLADCPNFIRVLEFLNASHIYACGTFAFSPRCTYIHSDTLTMMSLKPDEGRGRCPYDPYQRNTAIIVVSPDAALLLPVGQTYLELFPLLPIGQTHSELSQFPMVLSTFPSDRPCILHLGLQYPPTIKLPSNNLTMTLGLYAAVIQCNQPIFTVTVTFI
ncbi:hypothetical protein LDENG_00287620 [Lucifuga dentata]|nr:hypothetical protein LDENG_00287620 [Lucifuga dentata]